MQEKYVFFLVKRTLVHKKRPSIRSQSRIDSATKQDNQPLATSLTSRTFKNCFSLWSASKNPICLS